MTTRAHLASGATFDIDEETEGYFTHMNDDPVIRWEYVGPTPPGSKRAPGVSAAQRRAELQAELDALDELEPPPPTPAEERAALQARLNELGGA